MPPARSGHGSMGGAKSSQTPAVSRPSAQNIQMFLQAAKFSEVRIVVRRAKPLAVRWSGRDLGTGIVRRSDAPIPQLRSKGHPA